MYRSTLLLVTAIAESLTGLALLIDPAGPLQLLTGVGTLAPEDALVARLTGAALLSIAVTCAMSLNADLEPALRGLLAGLLVYNVGAAALLAHTGATAASVGVALWPAVVLHVGLAVWCVLCQRTS